MKKLVSLFLALAMLLSVASIAVADEPLHILFWHNRGSGANYDVMKASVDTFNETVGKEKGIFVDEVYIGGYPEMYSKLQLASQSGEQPVVCVEGNTYVAPLMDDGILADMMPYAQATNFDVNNLLDCFLQIEGNTDGHLYSLPYVRSTPLLYYNKTMADAKGLTAPTTIDELIAFATAMSEKDANGETTVWGMEMYNDFGYYNAAFLWQLGEPMIDENGTSPALNGTSLLKNLTDWRSWVDAGICRPFDSTNAAAVAREMLYQGKLGCILESSGSLKNNLAGMEGAGLELGVAYFPTYDPDNRFAECGGGQICLVASNNTDEQLKAGWEFLQFLMSDEQVYLNTIGSGYLPVTKSVANFEQMKAFWAENPHYKTAFDQLSEIGICQEYPFFLSLQEFIQNIQDSVSLLIQDGGITPEEAVQQIKDNTSHLF